MADLKSVVAEKLPLTMGETIALAKEYGVRVVDVVLTESELRTGLDREGVLKAVMEEYAHNLKAVEIGVSGGNQLPARHRSHPAQGNGPRHHLCGCAA